MKERCINLMAELTRDNIDSALVTSPLNRRYFSGFTGSNAVLIISAEKRVLLTDFRYTIQANNQCKGVFEVRQVSRGITAEEIASVLREFGAARCAFEDAALTVAEFESYRSLPVELIPKSAAIDSCRLKKSSEEVELIQKAQNVADSAFAELLKLIKRGMTEKDVRNELDYLLRKHGADENSFDTIVGSGPNGALCHAYPGERKLQDGDLVVIDFGAKVNGYCSDMTRTIAIGTPCDELKKIYNIVLEAQLKCLEQLKPGMAASALDAVARDYITEHGYGECFGHSLGHGFGLDIHESPYASTRSNDTLEPGITITVEPGIYIEGLGGVRIEDCCVLTEDGFINLCSTTKELIIL